MYVEKLDEGDSNVMVTNQAITHGLCFFVVEYYIGICMSVYVTIWHMRTTVIIRLKKI